MEDFSEFKSEQRKLNKLSVTASLISAVAATIGLVVGSIGVYLGWQSFNFTKDIEQLRYRPHLTLHTSSDLEQKSFLFIKNNGPGLAQFKSIRFWREDSTQAINFIIDEQDKFAFHISNSLKMLLSENIQKADASDPNILVPSYPSSHVLAAGESLRLLQFEDRGRDNEDYYNSVHFALEKYFFEIKGNYLIEFCSIDGSYCSWLED